MSEFLRVAEQLLREERRPMTRSSSTLGSSEASFQTSSPVPHRLRQ